MTKKEFCLVNPVIAGNINTKIEGKNHLDAAKKMYDALSENFNNNVPTFYFTIQEVNGKTKMGEGKLADYKHFKVVETKDKKGKEVSFRITEAKIEKNNENMKKFRSELKKVNNKLQKGGEHKYDDDWDDDDDNYFSSPVYRYDTVMTTPIDYWWYDPYLYRVNKYYVPTFTAPLAPYIEIPLYTSW